MSYSIRLPSTITNSFGLGPPWSTQTWPDDDTLLQAKPEPSPCLESWEHHPQFFNQDYQLVTLEQSTWEFLVRCGNVQGQKTVRDRLKNKVPGQDSGRVDG
ncbi:MAG: hypothetical protein AAF622_04885 [Cyanobacteria bacterium P01_C01_bin.147]